eukprot:gnl/TRDRNA2_/TRDRNA2_176311_c0_seq24.p1 gnl/TRDRNA2_/TRDRNA2_176311_c0~~gnl/TRDRNA2_/TRDRNA2_176311_c0_seq24.p1  ORF type:complete len:482 (+),score=115.63 gnl/TRDRNA2_/TRDRNA2_176311_c0_seq24:76-1521(+)
MAKVDDPSLRKVADNCDDNGQAPAMEETYPAKQNSKPPAVFDFADSEAMKERVRQTLLKKPQYNVFDFYYEDGVAPRIAKHPVFENVTLSIIALNAVWIAVDTDYNEADTMLEAEWYFQVMEHFFCTYFTFEWIVRFLSFRRKLDGLKDGWFKFDSLLVLLMVVETWFFSIVALGGGGANPLGGNTAILRLFRLLRLSRLLRMLKSLPELMILIKGMATAMKSVSYVICLLVIITYVFAIAFVQLAPDGGYIADQFFAHVPLAMYSLLIYGTFLDNLADFCNAIRAESEIGMVLALLFIYFACMTVMNMLIGVLCEVITAVAETEKEERITSLVKEKMSNIVTGLDTDYNGKISYKEFTSILHIPEALLALQDVGVDPAGLVDFADLFFLEDGEYVELEFHRFMEMVLDLRDSNNSTVKDIMNLWTQISGRFNVVKEEVREVRECVSRCDKETKEAIKRIEKLATEVLNEAKKGFENPTEC